MDEIGPLGPPRRHPRRTEDALAAALGIMSLAPERGSQAVAAVLTRLAHTEKERMISSWLSDFVAPRSPGAAFVGRVTTQLDPRVRRRFLARMLANLFRDPAWFERFTRAYGFPPPSTLAISPSMRCNLRCAGCYAGMYERADDLSADLVDRVIGEAEAMGICLFVLIGGEPFMWPPLLDVIEAHPGSVFQIYTNGLLIDDKIADRLVELGNVAPAVSIEGGSERTDARRGRGTYDRVIDTMERLRDHGVLFSFSATATRENIDEITSDEFVDLMIEKGALYGWYFAYMPIGLGPDLTMMPTPEQRQHLRREVNRIRREKPILVADFWNDGPLTGGCIAAGRQYLHINNHGDVEPCVFCHFAVDNIKETTLLNALRSPFFQDLRRQQPFGEDLLRPCPLIDHPSVMRRTVERHGARPTHEGAESLVTSLQPGLHDYAIGLRDACSPAWREDYRWVDTWLGGDERWRRRRARGRDADAAAAKPGPDQAVSAPASTATRETAAGKTSSLESVASGRQAPTLAMDHPGGTGNNK